MIIANLIFFRYINPAIIAPEAFDVVMDITTIQRKNLSTVSQQLNLIT